jgi:HlyD family secretion protein
VDVDEADVGAVQSGQEAAFTVDAYPDSRFPARITQIRYSSETVNGVVTYKAVLRVDNSELLLRPGMTATAVITVKKVENALLVPNAALRFVPPETPQAGDAEGGSLISSLLPHPPRRETKQKEETNGKSKEQKVWTLRNGQLTAVVITKGISDGRMTEITGGDVEPGMALVTDMETVK